MTGIRECAASSAACLPDTKCAPAHLGNVLVLGLGKSGKSVARYCAALVGSRVDELFVAAGAPNGDSQAFVESISAPHVAYAFGDDALADLDVHFDVCIASPGIPFYHELYVRALELSDEVVSEVEFSWRESAADSVWVALTGTNGKTTTTSCAAHLLGEAGLAASAVGNIGDVCLDAVVAGETDVYVAEVSSYQLYSTRLFAPDVAVMLNITPDHLHWHKTLAAYRDAKFKLLDNLSMSESELPSPEPEALPEHAEAPAPCSGGAAAELARCARSDSPRSRSARTASQPQRAREPLPARGRAVAILDAANDVVRAKVRELKALSDEERGFAYIPMGTKAGLGGDMRAACGAANAAFIDAEGVFRIAFDGVEHVVGNVSDLQIKGEHNASNALAAAAVAVVLGVPDDAIASALASFAPLEHRIEPCGQVDGVECYNDSKATNVDATVKAIGSFPGRPLVVLLGGDDKDTELDDLVRAAHDHARAVVCFGAGGPRFAAAFEDACDNAPEGFVVERAGHMEEALDCALELCVSGDVLLLSPACASFDEFSSFEHRGRVFKQLVSERVERAASRGE